MHRASKTGQLTAFFLGLIASAMPVDSQTFALGADGPVATSVQSATRAPVEDGVLSGVVVRADGRPQQGAIVRFVWNDGGQSKVVRCRTDESGSFDLLAEPNVDGALHASLYGYRAASSTIDPVPSGSTGLELRLRGPEFLSFDIEDTEGNAVEGARAKFSWILSGFEIRDSPGPFGGRLSSSDGLWWEKPSVPFTVFVSAFGHEPRTFGPFDPTLVESPLVLKLVPFPHVRGRVVHGGSPVAGASVQLRGIGPARGLNLELFASRQPWAHARTDEQGNYALVLENSGSYSLRAWSPTLGEGGIQRIALDSTEPPQALELELTRAPGSIAGKVVLPTGHVAAEVLLSVSDHGGYMELAQDGSFVLPDLPPGQTKVLLRRGPGPGGGAVSNTVSRDAGSQWITMSHGPARAPAWLRSEPTFQVQVIAGEQAPLTIDLTREGSCRLEGQVLVNGAAPRHAPRQWGMYFAPEPRVSLDRGDSSDYVSRCELDEEGRFRLQAPEPGLYRLTLALPVGESIEWTVVDAVQLETGTTPWKHNFTTGSARVLTNAEGWDSLSSQGALRWRGPGELRVFMRSSEENEERGELSYEAVPTGNVQLYLDSGGQREVLMRHQVRAGEQAVYRLN